MTRDETVEIAYTETFRALSDPTRFDMFMQIASVDEMPCTVLQGNVGLAKSTISYHIKVLVQAELVSVRKQGRHFFYTARRETVQELLPGFLSRVGVPRRPRVTPS